MSPAVRSAHTPAPGDAARQRAHRQHDRADAAQLNRHGEVIRADAPATPGVCADPIAMATSRSGPGRPAGRSERTAAQAAGESAYSAKELPGVGAGLVGLAEVGEQRAGGEQHHERERRALTGPVSARDSHRDDRALQTAKRAEAERVSQLAAIQKIRPRPAARHRQHGQAEANQRFSARLVAEAGPAPGVGVDARHRGHGPLRVRAVPVADPSTLPRPMQWSGMLAVPRGSLGQEIPTPGIRHCRALRPHTAPQPPVISGAEQRLARLVVDQRLCVCRPAPRRRAHHRGAVAKSRRTSL